MQLFHIWVMTGSLLSVILAFCGVIIALRVLRMNSQHIFSIYDFSAHGREDHSGFYHQFELKICVKGLPFSCPSVYLSFNENNNWGSRSIEFVRFDPVDNREVDDSKQIDRGSVATFKIDIRDCDDRRNNFARESLTKYIDDAVTNRCRIQIYENGVLVAERKCRLFERGLVKWNGWMSLLEYKTAKQVTTPHGTAGIKYRFHLPRFKQIISWPVNSMSRMLKQYPIEMRELEAAKNQSPPTAQPTLAP